MKVDKMMSAFGLEAREPFLDYKLAEFCFSLNANDKISFNQTKVLFRKIMADLLPKEILKRKKHGFLLPSERWLMGPLKKITQEMIFSRESFSSRFFSEEELGSLFEQSTSLLKIEKASLLWRLLIFEFWYKINFEKVV